MLVRTFLCLHLENLGHGSPLCLPFYMPYSNDGVGSEVILDR